LKLEKLETNMLRSDNPIKSYGSLHRPISYWRVGALSTPTSIEVLQVASRWNFEAY